MMIPLILALLFAVVEYSYYLGYPAIQIAEREYTHTHTHTHSTATLENIHILNKGNQTTKKKN